MAAVWFVETIPTKHTCRPQGLIMPYDRAGRFRVLLGFRFRVFRV